MIVDRALLLRCRLPLVFSFPTEERSNRLLLKVGNSSWSKVSMSRRFARLYILTQTLIQPISVEGVGGDSEVTIGEDRADATHHVGFSYIEGLGKVGHSHT